MSKGTQKRHSFEELWEEPLACTSGYILVICTSGYILVVISPYTLAIPSTQNRAKVRTKLKTARPQAPHLFNRCHSSTTLQGLVQRRSSPHCFLPQPLDYERIQQYSFTIEATDPTIDLRYLGSTSPKNIARVIINVTDVDEPPIFQQPFYHFQLQENQKKPLIGSVLAKDPDAAQRDIR